MTDMTVPLGPGDDDITAFQRNMEQRRQQRLRDTIMSATRQDPRRALESYKYGLSLTAPQEMVEQTKQQFQGLSLYQRIKNNPTTASMFMDSQFAAVAAPDAESIGFLESLYRVPASALLDVAGGGMRAMEESITQMRIDMDQAAIEKTTQFLSQPDLTDEQRQIAEANLFSAQERINGLRQNLDPTYFSQLRSTLEQFSDEIRISPTSGLGQVLASAGHSTSIAVPFLFLGPLGMIAAFAASEYGAASRDAELRGADLETRRGRGARSSFYGAALGALPVVNMFGRAAAGVGLRANILRTIGQEIPTEVATEVIDTVDRILTFEPDRLFTEETLRELGETTVITALSTVLSVGATTTALHKIGAAANRQQENIDSANASADALRQAGDTIASTQVLGSTANLLSSVANRIAEDTNTQGRRIDVDTFVSLIDQLGGEQAVRSTLPNVMSQVDELGTGVGQEIVLTAGEYATQIQNNPRLRSILEPHVRVGYDELSATEAQEAEQSVAEFAEVLNQKLEADAEKAAAKNADRDALRDRIIDSVLSQPPFRQAVQAEQAGPEVLEAPRVTPEYSGPEPTIPAEMLSEGQGQDVGEIKFSKWDELAEFLDEKDEVGTLNALQAFAGRLSPRTEAGQQIALDIVGSATGDQYQKLTASLTTLASDLERVTDSVSDALYNSVVRFDEVSESVRQSGVNALVAIVNERIASNGKISDSTKSEVNAAKESLLTSSKETKEYKAAANLLIDFVVERLDYRSSLLAAKQLDKTFALIDSDRQSPLEAVKEAMAFFFGYEYLGSDTMISERGAWEQAMVRQSFEDAGLEAPRVTPGIDAAYMAAIEAGDMETAQQLVDQAAEQSGFVSFDENYPTLSSLVSAVKRGELLVHARAMKASDVQDAKYGIEPQWGSTLQSTEAASTAEEFGITPAELVFASDSFSWAGKGRNGLVFVRTEGFQKSLGDGRVQLPDGSVVPYELSPIADYEDDSLRSEPFGVETGDWYSTTTADVVAVSLLGEEKADAITRDAEGNVIPISKRFDVEQPSILYAPQLPRITPEQDAAYMEAVESGDTQAQQVAVDQRAKAAGYDVEVFRGVAKDREDIPQQSFEAGFGIFTNDNPDVAHIFRYEREYGEVITEIYNEETDEYEEVEPGAMYRLYINKGRSLDLSRDEIQRDGYSYKIDPQRFTDDTGYQKSVLLVAKEQGYDSIVVPDVDEGVGEWTERGTTIVLFRPEQLKSADPITRDAEGNIIPLSQRFDVTQESILYAPETGGDQLRAEQVKASAEIAAEMFSNLAENILGVSPQTMWDTYGANIIQDLETMTPEQRQAAESAAGAYYPKSMSVILGQKQTADTLIHELTHHYLHILSTVALQPSTSPNAAANEAVVKARRFFEDILVALDDTGEMAAKGFGAVEHWQSLSADAKRDIHETFAYGFQKYLGTAKAPTNKLRDAYAKVRRWMTELYGRGLKKLGIIFEQRYKRQLPALTPEVIAIFDRMVGSEIAIAKANEVDNAVPLFLSKEESGMTDEQWGRLQEATRRRDDEAIVQMMARFHRDMRWTTRSISRFVAKTQREVSKQRGRIRNEVRAEVEERPVYRALRFFRTGMVRNQQGELVKVEGSHRLDIETVKERYSALDWKSLGFGRNGALGKNGLDPDVIAVDLDFESGDELIRAMLDAAPINDVITSLTEQRLLAEHGEMMDPMAVEAAAIESVRNKHQATLSSLEQSFLEGGTRPAQALRRAAQIAAQQRLGKMALGEIKPHQFALAAKRASKVAQQAFRDGRQQDALKAKREQLAMEMAHLEAKKIQKRVEKRIKQLRKLRSNAKNESVGADYADRINTVLSKLSVEKGVALHVPRPQVVRATLEQHVAAMEADQQGSGLTATTDRIPPKTEDEPYTVLDEINSMGVTYVYDMPLEQFDDIMRVVDELVHIGRQITKGRLLTIKADADAVLKELAETAGKYNSRLRISEQAQTKLERFVAGAKGIASSHITAQSKFIIMDGGEYGGVHFKTFVAPTSEIGDAETAAIMEATQKVQAILKPLYDQKGFNVRVFRPEVGLSKSPKQIVFATANMLNETNEQRLVSGEEWGVPMPADADDDVQDQVYAARRQNIINMIQNHLTADQVRMAQQMSDLFADFKPETAKLYRDTSGTEPRWVEPRPITFQMASGEEVTLRGGYYPIEYDRYGSTTGLKRIMAKLADSLRRTGPTAATTSNAYTKSRVSRVVNAPLLLDDTVLTSALEEVIHDLHWRRWSIDMNRLMRPGTVWYETMRANYGADFVSELINWRNRTASGGVVESNQAAKKLLSYAGKYASQASLLFNPGSVLIQPIGMLAIDPATGTKHANYGRTRVMTDFKAAYSEMMSRTPQMKLRYITRHRELREINLRIRGKSTNTAAIEAAGYQLMQSAQSIADVAAWHAGFNMAIEQGKTHEEAGKIAYQVVLDTQSSGRVQDLSEVETGLIGYLFNSFYRPLNAQFNLVARKAVLTDQEKRAAKKGLVKDLAMLFVLMPYVIMLMKRAVRPPEKEDEEFWTVENQMTLLTSETLKALASNFIGIREMQEFFPALLGEQAYRYTGPTKLRLANDIINLGSQIGQGIRGVGEGDPSKLYDKGMIRSISNVLGDLFGFPSAAINGLVEGITAAIEGRVYPFDEDGDLPPWAIITGTSK